MPYLALPRRMPKTNYVQLALYYEGGEKMAGKLANYMPETYKLPVLSPSDVEGEEIEFTGAYFLAGNYGDYVMAVVNLPNGERVLIRTGAHAIVESLKSVKEANAFPVTGRIIKRGRSWIVE